MSPITGSILQAIKRRLKNSSVISDLFLAEIVKFDGIDSVQKTFSQYGQDLLLGKLLNFLPIKNEY